MKFAFVFAFILMLVPSLFASDADEELVDSLKIEANHNRTRLQSFKIEASGNKIFDDERERGLGEFLEEQEKWDLLRERGLQDYRASKREASPREGGPEFQEYLEQKESEEARYERSRKIHVSTRDKITEEFKANVTSVEAEELGLANNRPRYELRKRGKNKWANAGNTKGRIGGAGSNSPSADFPPQTEFPAAPMPYETPTEDIPPPPPPVYDQNGNSVPFGGDPGGDINIPPPPPPPPDFDF